MGIINTEPKSNIPSQKSNQNNLDAFVTFRLTSQQLQELKLQAIKEKRSTSNYIKNYLF
jgi:hypothetical protein